MRTFWPSLICVTAAALAPIEAAGFCLNVPEAVGEPVAWETKSVTYRVSDNLTDPKLLGAIDAAFQTWQSVSCAALELTKGDAFTICTESDAKDCPAGTVHLDHQAPHIYVFWYDASNKDAYPGDPASPYVPKTVYGLAPRIAGATVAINAFAYTWNADGGDAQGKVLDLQNEATTMVGLVIGLADPGDAGSSLYTGPMKYGDVTKRTLTQDDMDGLRYVYLDTEDPSCTRPAAPGGDGCSGGQAPAGDGQGPGGGDGPATQGDAGPKPGGDAAGEPTGQDGGCACRAGSPSSDLPLSGLLWLGVLLALGQRRVHRRGQGRR